MEESLFQRVLVPVASREDAATTTSALVSQVDAVDGSVIAVHVIEKTRGSLDKASIEQRERDTVAIFDIVREGLTHTEVPLETQVLYGTDVAATIIDAAHEANATAIMFTPRGGSHWIKLLTGDVTHELVEDSDVPIVVLPEEEEKDLAEE
ncbi:MAG: nucleotide-binding universal stress UspA family protein [Halobacteriales archaeon]|jgi:nucleotide-binding universal stress UspA family protein